MVERAKLLIDLEFTRKSVNSQLQNLKKGIEKSVKPNLKADKIVSNELGKQIDFLNCVAKQEKIIQAERKKSTKQILDAQNPLKQSLQNTYGTQIDFLNKINKQEKIISAQRTKSFQSQLDAQQIQQPQRIQDTRSIEQLKATKVFDSAGIVGVQREIANLGKTYNQLNDAGLLNKQTVKALEKQYVQFAKVSGNAIKNISKELKQVAKATQQINFDFLSLIFAGIALQATFGKALTSIIDNYKVITGLNSVFNKSVLALSANWSFLKFSIANALNTPFIIRSIQLITDGLEDLSFWFLENKGFALGLLGAFALLFGAGTVSVLLGSILQIGIQVKAMGNTFRKIPKLVTEARLALLTFSITTGLILILVTVAAIVYLMKKFPEVGEEVKTSFDKVGEFALIAAGHMDTFATSIYNTSLEMMVLGDLKVDSLFETIAKSVGILLICLGVGFTFILYTATTSLGLLAEGLIKLKLLFQEATLTGAEFILTLMDLSNMFLGTNIDTTNQGGLVFDLAKGVEASKNSLNELRQEQIDLDDSFKTLVNDARLSVDNIITSGVSKESIESTGMMSTELDKVAISSEELTTSTDFATLAVQDMISENVNAIEQTPAVIKAKEEEGAAVDALEKKYKNLIETKKKANDDDGFILPSEAIGLPQSYVSYMDG